MNSKNLFTLSVFLATVGVFIWGCQTSQPVTPYKNVALSVSVPATNEVKASLLGVASNELLYRVDGPGHSFLTSGTVGPFSTAASSGSIDFTANVPAKDNLVLSIQLNDASSNQPLAVGATGLNMFSAPVTDVVIEMGSVTRNCYFVNEKTNLYGGSGNLGSNYTFNTDTLVNGVSTGGYDIGMSIVGLSGYLLVDAQGNSLWPYRWSIAYLGNGDFVTHDMRPPDNNFFPNSGTAKQYAASTGYAPAAATTQVQVGDIYCVLTSAPALNYATAWVQITDPGFPTTQFGYGPSFRFRLNSTLLYFGYERTSADTANSCSALW